jgi:hypothetical protein
MKLVIVLATFLSFFSPSETALFKEHDPKQVFVTKEGQLTPPLIELLRLDHLYDENDTLSDVVKKTQAVWIATAQGANSKERSDIKDTPEQQAMREKVEDIARKMGLFSGRQPLLIHYNDAICLGAFLDAMRLRLADLVSQWNAGIRFDELIFLTGERYLRKNPGQEDDLEKLKNPALSPLPFKAGWTFSEQSEYETEYHLAKLLFDQVELPEEMAKALEGKVTFVNVPRGNAARPSTKDTYRVWLQDHHPKPGTLLAASTPMLWIYQQIVGENVLGDDYLLDTIAPDVSPEMLKKYRPAIVTLVKDTVAKSLFEINRN